MQTKVLERLQYISQGLTLSEQKHNSLKALDAGAKWIQIRWKKADEKEIYVLAQYIQKLCKQYEATCIINDHVNMAKDLDLDGVHLGLDDCSITVARDILGTTKIIGGTANTFDDISRRIAENCDYIGLGPFKYTTTKKDLSPLLGLSGYQNALGQMREQGLLTTPIFAIGGISNILDIQNLIEAGVYGIALSGLVTEKPHLISSIKKFLP